MSHGEYQDLLALHALGALDAPDARALAEHLAECEECRTELEEARDATALLAYAAPPAAPRDGVPQRILQAIGSQPQRVEPAAHVLSMNQPRPRTVWPSILRLAAAIAFVALLLGIVVLWRRNVESRREVAQLSEQLTHDREMLARQRDVLAMLNSPDAKKMALAGAQTAKNARAMFVYDQK